MRDNRPFGRAGAGEFGTYFIGCAGRPEVTERMLRNMFIGDPPGNTDRILEFSTAVTGSLFFVPSADFLDDLTGPPPPAAGEPATAEPAADAPPDPTAPPAGPPGDGSLGIGSLRVVDEG